MICSGSVYDFAGVIDIRISGKPVDTGGSAPGFIAEARRIITGTRGE